MKNYYNTLANYTRHFMFSFPLIGIYGLPLPILYFTFYWFCFPCAFFFLIFSSFSLDGLCNISFFLSLSWKTINSFSILFEINFCIFNVHILSLKLVATTTSGKTEGCDNTSVSLLLPSPF